MDQPNATRAPEAEPSQALADLVAKVRSYPGDYRTPAALAAAAGVDLARLRLLFRRHLHQEPEAFLEAARVDAACDLLLGRFGPAGTVGADCGFFSPSTFQASFKRRTGLTPARYQALGQGGASFRLDLPADYRPEDVLAYHGRDPHSLSERVEAGVLAKGLQLEGQGALVELAFTPGAVKATLRGAPADARRMAALHRKVVRMLGLGLDPAPFEGALAADPAFQALVAPRRGLRIPLTADVWEALVWAILGQQVNLAFAYTLRRRLTDLCGTPLSGGLKAHPGPRQVAALDPADLAPLQFSRGKADYLVRVAHEVAAGELDLESMPLGPATLAEAELGARRGVGPWTTHYVLMRGCGFGDCVPLGDAGLSAALQRHFGLDHRPGAKETAALMAPFAPHRSLATFHLWASLKGVPA